MVGHHPRPSDYDPRRHPERARARRDFVLGKMLETGLIEQAEHDRAVAAPLGVSERPGSAAANRFPAYVDLVRRHLAADYSAGELQGAGLAVMTSMSPSAQAYAEAAVKRTMKALDNARRPALETGLVVTDVHNGEVVAVVGSRDVSTPGFNRAVEAQRPVGSLLKPFVYLLALALPDRWSLATWVDDSPVTVTLDNGKRWNPGNSDGRSHGSVRLVDALARSYNQATVRVGMAVRPERLANLIKQLAGIEAAANPALILGSVDQSPYAMAQLYQFLASDGEIQPLYTVRGVLGEDGRVLKRYDKAPPQPDDGDATARGWTLALRTRFVRTASSWSLRLGKLNAAADRHQHDGATAGCRLHATTSLGLVSPTRTQTACMRHGPSDLVGPFKAMPSARCSRDKDLCSGVGLPPDATSGGAPLRVAEGFGRHAALRATAYSITCRRRAGAEPGGGWREWLGFGRDRDAAAEPTVTPPPPPPSEPQP